MYVLMIPPELCVKQSTSYRLMIHKTLVYRLVRSYWLMISKYRSRAEAEHFSFYLFFNSWLYCMKDTLIAYY